MELKVTYKQKEVCFSLGDQKGEGFEELIEFVGKNKDKANRISISGESDSYTFSRQIYLFANLSAALTKAKVFINDEAVTADRQVFPTYK